MAYGLHNPIEFTCTFAPLEGESGTSTAVAIRLRKPDGTETDYTEADDEVTNPDDNVWRFLTDCDQTGRWSVRFRSTTGLEAAATTTVTVPASPVSV